MTSEVKEGNFSHLLDTFNELCYWVFPVRARPSLMTLWSRLHNDPQRHGLINGTRQDLILTWKTEREREGRYAPSGSNTQTGESERNTWQERKHQTSYKSLNL